MLILLCCNCRRCMYVATRRSTICIASQCHFSSFTENPILFAFISHSDNCFARLELRHFICTLLCIFAFIFAPVNVWVCCAYAYARWDWIQFPYLSMKMSWNEVNRIKCVRVNERVSESFRFLFCNLCVRVCVCGCVSVCASPQFIYSVMSSFIGHCSKLQAI